MPRLSTQPAVASAVSLRSGFYALPLSNGKLHVAVRALSTASAEDEHEHGGGGFAADQTRLFATSLPIEATQQAVKRLLSKVLPRNTVTDVDLVASAETTSSDTLLAKDRLVSSVKEAITPLFPPATQTLPAVTPSPSAIVSFDSPVTVPPEPYQASTAFHTSTPTSYLSRSRARHSLARPHRSTTIAHADSWMNEFDARRRQAASSAHAAIDTAIQDATHLSLKQRKKLKRAARAQAQSGPTPGSAAAALAAYAALQAKLADQEHNPDEPDEEGWTLVTSGGRHGKSSLPEGAEASVTGYGATTFQVAKPNKLGRPRDDSDQEAVSGDEGPAEGSPRKKPKAQYESGVRKTVGSGFYRFTKQAERRQGQSAT